MCDRAARAHRGRVAVAAFDAHAIALDLRTLAGRLDDRATEVAVTAALAGGPSDG